MKIRDFVTAAAVTYALYRAVVFLIQRGSSSTRISACLGTLHELLQLNADDHTVQYEDGSEATVPEAIDFYIDQLIEELQHG